ncbi:MAG TPA: hypothetical protein VF765_23320 [Polyangiaceae bacterium]
MTQTKDPNKPTRKERLRQIMAGAQKHNTGTMILNGRTFNMPGDLVNEIQSDLNDTDDATQAHGAWMAKVATMRASHAALDPLLSLFKRRVISEVGDTQEAQGILADYGWTPPKKAKRKVEDKMVAVQKTIGTRKLRGTMGSNQKKKVKAGQPAPVVTDPSAVPQAASVAPVAVPTPATGGNGNPPKPTPPAANGT